MKYTHTHTIFTYEYGGSTTHRKPVDGHKHKVPQTLAGVRVYFSNSPQSMTCEAIANPTIEKSVSSYLLGASALQKTKRKSFKIRIME